MSASPFTFVAPAWANDPKGDLTAEEALARAEELAQGYYPLGVKTGIHSMIEWCGVMTEYVKMLQVALEGGHDPRKVDQHHGRPVSVPDFMIAYFCEKLGCQIKPFIAAEPALWREAIEQWFPKAQEEQESEDVTTLTVCIPGALEKMFRDYVDSIEGAKVK